MRPAFWAIVALAAAIVLFFVLRGEAPTPSAPVQISSSQITDPVQKAPPRPSSPPVSTAARPVDKKPDRPVPRQAEPPGELVHFEVDDGLAVAFGDVILGEVEDGAEISEGFFQPPRPRLWERNEIPYAIEPDVPDPDRIRQALKHFEGKTPLRFIEFDGQEDAIVFVRHDEHCYSYLGRIGGHQPIKLSDRCTWIQIVHEVMHALGFIHEHTRNDRDAYVDVLWDNIDEKYYEQFAMVPEPLMEAVKGTPFDFASAMIYPPNAFAVDPTKPTMRAKEGRRLSVEQQPLSPGDIERIRHLYGD